MKPLYQHVCGYPIKEGRDIEHCPGCGGRLTPWNVTPVPEVDQFVPYKAMAAWLAQKYPALAKGLIEATGRDLEETSDSTAQAWLRPLHRAISEALEEK